MSAAYQFRKPVAHIEVDKLRHPADQKACAALEAIPYFHTAAEKAIRHSLERYLYITNTADNVRVTPAMFPTLHRELRFACEMLGVPEPEMYVDLDPQPDAYTIGHTRPFIVFSSGLIDTFDENERLFIFAHELGHIKAGHTLYLTMAFNIGMAVEALAAFIPVVGKIVYLAAAPSIELPLLHWRRKAELTADRLGLLCVQNIDLCIKALMRLAGGGTRLDGEMRIEEFKRQVASYQSSDFQTLDKIYKVMQTVYRTHPFPVLRAKELLEWYEGGYRRILEMPLGEDRLIAA